MKIYLHTYLIAWLGGIALLAGGSPAYAQKNLKSLPEVLKNVKQSAAVVPSKLVTGGKAPAVLSGVSQANLSAAVGRAAAAQVLHAPAGQAVRLTTPLADMQALTNYRIPRVQKFQALFTPAQLNAIQQAFIDTDEWMFVRGADGKLSLRYPNEWNYRERFITILKESSVSFTEKQFLQIIGGKETMGFSFFRYLTVKNVMAFALAKGRLPRTSIAQNGKQVSLTQLRAQAETGEIEAVALAQEMELGRSLATARSNWPKDCPEYQMLEGLEQQYRANETPAQVLANLKQFMLEHQHAPRQAIGEKGKLFSVVELRARAQAGDVEAADLVREVTLGKQLKKALTTWPADLPEYQELAQLYDQYKNMGTVTQKIELIKQFMLLNGRAPRQSIGQNGKQFPLAQLRARAQAGDPEAAELAHELEIGIQLNYILSHFPKESVEYQTLKTWYDQYRNTDTSAQVVEGIKEFVLQNGRMPRRTITQQGEPLSLVDLRARAENGDPKAAELAKELELGQRLIHVLYHWPKNSQGYKEIKALYEQYKPHRKTPKPASDNLYHKILGFLSALYQ